jgi:hypothetical protein
VPDHSFGHRPKADRVNRRRPSPLPRDPQGGALQLRRALLLVLRRFVKRNTRFLDVLSATDFAVRCSEKEERE